MPDLPSTRARIVRYERVVNDTSSQRRFIKQGRKRRHMGVPLDARWNRTEASHGVLVGSPNRRMYAATVIVNDPRPGLTVTREMHLCDVLWLDCIEPRAYR